MVYNHVTIHKFDKFPRLWAFPWPEKPAVCRLVVRVIILVSTISWQLGASGNQLATEGVCAPFDIAVAFYSGAVRVSIAVFLIIMTSKTFEIIVGACDLRKYSFERKVT